MKGSNTGTVAGFPTDKVVSNEKRVSTYWVEDGSFLKLRNVQLGYNIPKRVCEKMHLK